MSGIKILLVEDDWKISELKPDLVLLDIGLSGEMSGIETAQLIKKDYQIPFIFLTALADSSTIEKAKLTEPYAYLVKPVKIETLYSTIEITLYNAAQRKEVTPILKEGLTIDDSIFVKTKGRLEKLQLNQVLWVEASDIYALVCTAAGKYLLNTSLAAVEEKFPSSRFLRVHRSYIVNVDKIEAIEKDELIINQQRIPIGKTYKDKLMSKLSFL
jgi:DNA-binding LytR/AlgR family response regulator